MAGMAQKGGPVTTHVRLAARPGDLHAARISSRAADLILGCDLVVAAGKEALGVIGKDRTNVVLNAEETITGAFIRDPNFRIPGGELAGIIKDVAGSAQVQSLDATRIAAELLGDSIGANLLLVGYAWQRGLIPLSLGGIDRAIELNGTAVQMNRMAFRLGRLCAQDPAAVQALMPKAHVSSPLGHRVASGSLDEIVARRIAFLSGYQDAGYAEQYRSFVDQVRVRERSVTGAEGRLSEAVARYLFKLMAYKDEYEVARLYTDGTFRRQLAETFEGNGKLTFHLAPPLLARKDPNTGEPVKRAFGPWVVIVFALIARLRGLRGTMFDLFGYGAERRSERALIIEYRRRVEATLQKLAPGTLASAIAIAEVPEEIRGFGPVKQRSLEAAQRKWAELERSFEGAPLPVAAE
jgi:indolepyruvate ferredoxin oxidoreductase